MSADDDKLLQIKRYLGHIPLEVRQKLMAAIEQRKVVGETLPEFDFILNCLRELSTDKDDMVDRMVSPMRLFFGFLDPFLTDRISKKKHPGVIPRSVLEPVWLWINRDLMPGEMPALVDDIKDNLLAGKSAEVDVALARAKAMLAPALREKLAEVEHDEVLNRKLNAALGGGQMLAHLHDIYDALVMEPIVQAMQAEIPDGIREPSRPVLKLIVRAMQEGLRESGPRAHLLHTALMSRFTLRPDALRVATAAIGSDNASDLETSSYAAIGENLIAELGELAADIAEAIDDTGFDDTVLHDVIEFGKLSARIRTIINVNPGSRWAKAMADARSRVSVALTPEIEKLGSSLKLVFKPIHDTPVEGPPDEVELGIVLLRIELIDKARRLVEELAISEVMARTRAYAETYIEAANAGVIEAIRKSDGQSRAYAQDYLAAAVKITEALHGVDFARIVRRLGEAAQASATDDRTIRAA